MRNRVKAIVFLLFFTFIIPNVFACGRKEKKNSPPVTVENFSTEGQNNSGTGNVIKLIGRVQIYGNEPHTFVGITDEKGTEFAVYPPEQEEKLRQLQGRLIEFTVIVLDEPRGYGSLFLNGGTINPIEWSIIR
jgi:hypothetical protein